MTESAAGDLSATDLAVPLEKVVHSSMKITCIRTHHLRDHLDVPFGFSQWFYGTRNTLWVEVEVHYAVHLPHGGLKQSGVGKDCSRYSLQEYLTLKRVSILVEAVKE